MKFKTIKPYIPYSGCKQRISERIIKIIKEKHPHKDVAIDLFGGGGAMSFEFLASGYKKVIYNELNIGYYSLIKFLKNRREFCISNKLPLKLPDYFYRFVDKESYSNIKIQNNNFLSPEQIAYKYFVISCYTFNNVQDKRKNDKRGYLYGSKKIDGNYYIHQALCYKDKKALAIIKNYFSLLGNITDLLDCCLQDNLQKAIYDFNRYNTIITFLFDNINKNPKLSSVISRLQYEIGRDKRYFEKHSQADLCKLFMLYGLDISKCKRISCSSFTKELFSCEHLSRMLHIEAILQLPLEKLECYNMSYDNFAITENNCVLLCDPPYYNTMGYDADTFDFARFSGWCYNCKHPLFVCEITNPNPNKLVSIWQHKIKDNVSNSDYRLEQLFWNGK